MGSCLSKKGLPTYHTKKRPRSKKKKQQQQQQHPAAVLGGAPVPPLPPSPPEEEAVVKEVLTETPTSCAFAAVSNLRGVEGDANVVKPPHKVSETTPPTSAVNGCRYGLGGRSEGEEGASTEICSASESFSVSTTLTEQRDAGAEDLEEQTSALRKRPSTRRRPPDRSPNAWKSYHQRTRSSSSGDLPSRRREIKCGAGGGKSSPSPVKRSSDWRSFPGRDAASTARQRAANGKVAAAGEARRERGERSGRGRSASPAAKRVAAGGGGEIRAGGGAAANRSSPMRRKAGPGRASPEQTPRHEDDDDCRQQMMVMRGGGGGGGSGGAEGEEGGKREEEGEGAMMPPAPVSDEMLENPLVSLECFIFL